MLEYLNYLIELEISVIRKSISDDDRAALANLELYKIIDIYNIYNRALKLFEKEDDNLSIDGIENGWARLMVRINEYNHSSNIFTFDFANYRNSSIPDKFKSMEIGYINLLIVQKKEKLN